MPIYAYRCDECGFSKDVLQKMSDPVLTDCLSCGKSTFKKQVTAAGFQLKGSGWYVTDFRGGKTATGAPAVTPAAPAAGASSDGAPSTTVAPAAGDAGKSATPAAAPASPAAGDKSAS